MKYQIDSGCGPFWLETAQLGRLAHEHTGLRAPTDPQRLRRLLVELDALGAAGDLERQGPAAEIEGDEK